MHASGAFSIGRAALLRGRPPLKAQSKPVFSEPVNQSRRAAIYWLTDLLITAPQVHAAASSSPRTTAVTGSLNKLSAPSFTAVTNTSYSVPGVRPVR